MPITFACSCGKTLRVKDEYTGRWVRWPACQGTAMVPEAEPQPAFEVVEDEPLPPPARGRMRAEPVSDKDDEDDDPPPRARRAASRDDDEEDDRPRRSRPKTRKTRSKRDQKPDHFALEKKVFNGGVAGGMLAMVIAVVWFVVGLMNDILFYYPPILFIIGLVGFFRGLAGGSDD